MTLQRQQKRLERAMRKIPVDAAAPSVAAIETGNEGLLCLVRGNLSFVQSHGCSEIAIDDELAYALIVRWVQAHPKRVHETEDSAAAFVQSQLFDRRHSND
jgi:hypothetical protein